MGWVMMSERDLNRIEIISQIVDGRLNAERAANLLALTKRQIFRLLRRFREDGPSALGHKARGKTPNNKIHDAKRIYAMDLVREKYHDFGPTMAAEMLEEHRGFKVSRETLRQWMQADVLWLSRKQRRTFHQPRLRRECYGELIQIDGSDHRWFEDRGPACTLLVFIDDATSKLMQLRFVKSESTFSYFDALEGYLHDHGRPVAFYSDNRGTARIGITGGPSQGRTSDGREWHQDHQNPEIQGDNGQQPHVQHCTKSVGSRFLSDWPQSEMGWRHQLHLDQRRLAVSCRHP